MRCCFGSPGKSAETQPHLVASLAQPFLIKLKLHSCCLSFLKCFSWQTRSVVSTIETIATMIKYILTFIPVFCIWQFHHSQCYLQKLSYSKYIQLRFRKSRSAWSNYRPICCMWRATVLSGACESIQEKSSNLKFVEKCMRLHLSPWIACAAQSVFLLFFVNFGDGNWRQA